MLILHGPNTVISRERLYQEIGRFEGEIIRLDGINLTLVELMQALGSGSLFGKDRLIVIEGLFARRPSKSKEAIVDYLKKNRSENLIIWEGKKIDGRVLVPLKANVGLFELSNYIFKFVEALLPENHCQKINLFEETLKRDPPEMIFGMIIRQIRLLIMASSLPKEKLKLSPWQISRLQAQAAFFTPKKLRSLYRRLLEIDIGQKTGRSPFGLRHALELWLVSF